MNRLPFTRLYQVATLAAASFVFYVLIAWLSSDMPLPGAPLKGDFSYSAMLRDFWQQEQFNLYLGRPILILLAGLSLVTAGLAVVFALKVPDQRAVWNLSGAFACGSLAVSFFLFGKPHRHLLLFGMDANSAYLQLVEMLADYAALSSTILIARFFVAYPRPLTPEQIVTFYKISFEKSRAKLTVLGWRRRLLNLEARFVNSLRTSSAAQSQEIPIIRALLSDKVFLWILPLVAANAIVSKWGPIGQTAAIAGAVFGVMLSLNILQFWLVAIPLSHLPSIFRMHRESSFADDQAKVEWIEAATRSVGILMLTLCVMGGLVALSVAFIVPILDPQPNVWIVKSNAYIWVTLPIIFLPIAVAYAFVGALAMSIFYRGAVDPRIAAHKITVFGVMGLVVALVFILVERTIALKIAGLLGLGRDYGMLIAGAAVTAGFAPVRNRAETVVRQFVSRYMPLEAIMDGRRCVQVIAISDLTGFTTLSGKDEKQALLLAALLQKLASKLVGIHGGTIVKSMGDAILFRFDDATTCRVVLTKLHQDFAPAADQFGLVSLQLHSGAHMGDVTITQDGDVYGQTVNIVARIQGASEAGQILLSDTVASTMDSNAIRSVGQRTFKNIAEPIGCYAIDIPSLAGA